MHSQHHSPTIHYRLYLWHTAKMKCCEQLQMQRGIRTQAKESESASARKTATEIANVKNTMVDDGQSAPAPRTLNGESHTRRISCGPRGTYRIYYSNHFVLPVEIHYFFFSSFSAWLIAERSSHQAGWCTQKHCSHV